MDSVLPGRPHDRKRLAQGLSLVEHGERHFCPDCGTGLFYYNAQFLPGIVDIQSVTLDDTAERAPQAHIQVADSLPWEAALDSLPRFERFPAQ